MVILVIIVIMVIPFDASERYPSGEGFQRLANCNGQGSLSF